MLREGVVPPTSMEDVKRYAIDIVNAVADKHPGRRDLTWLKAIQQELLRMVQTIVADTRDLIENEHSATPEMCLEALRSFEDNKCVLMHFYSLGGLINRLQKVVRGISPMVFTITAISKKGKAAVEKMFQEAFMDPKIDQYFYYIFLPMAQTIFKGYSLVKNIHVESSDEETITFAAPICPPKRNSISIGTDVIPPSLF